MKARHMFIPLGIIVLITLGMVMIGDGGFRRAVTLSGIYPILRPDGYDVVCFADSDSKEGGLSCLPCSLAGGPCNKGERKP